MLTYFGVDLLLNSNESAQYTPKLPTGAAALDAAAAVAVEGEECGGVDEGGMAEALGHDIAAGQLVIRDMDLVLLEKERLLHELVSSRLLTSPHDPHLSSRILTYSHVCSRRRMLTYAHGRMLACGAGAARGGAPAPRAAAEPARLRRHVQRVCAYADVC
jgi:hypothetical protein